MQNPTSPQPKNPVAAEFMAALGEAETSGNLEHLVGLFDREAELVRLNHEHLSRGQAGAHIFWNTYLAQFGLIRSSFTHMTEGTNSVVLEWISEGTLSDQTPIRYRGVSVLEIEQDKIARFRTYYDSAAFVPLGSKVKEGGSAVEEKIPATG